MSDWNRKGREDDRNRYGQDRYEAETRDRRDAGGRSRWNAQGQRSDEPRSFGERQPDPERGGYSGQRYGSQSYGGPTYGDQTYRRGQPYRSDDDASGRYRSLEEGRRSYVAEAYEPHDLRYGPDIGVVGANPPLRRQADGDTDYGWRSNTGMGEHRGRGPKNYTRSDERIREDLSDQLSEDSWLDASEIEVRVAKGEVTLTGTVQSREDKRRAEDLAEQVGGVNHVQNSLRIQPGQ